MNPRERWQAARAAAMAWYGRHSPRDQRIILGVVGFAVVSLLYVLVFVPVRDFRTAVAEEITTGQEELERAARHVGRADALRAERDGLQKKLQQARTRLLPGRSGTLGAAALQERTNAIASEKGVTVQSTQVMREEPVDPYRRVAVRLTLSGELKAFADMVSAIEYQQQLAIPFVEITRRGAVPGAKGPRTMTSTLEVQGYVLAAEEPKADETPEAGAGGEAGGETDTPANAPGEAPPVTRPAEAG